MQPWLPAGDAESAGSEKSLSHTDMSGSWEEVFWSKVLWCWGFLAGWGWMVQKLDPCCRVSYIQWLENKRAGALRSLKAFALS